MDENKFYGQKCQDEHVTEEFRKLHTKIVNEVINFCKENKVDIDEFHLSADGLRYSINVGTWHPGTDSSFTAYRKMPFSDNEKPFLLSV